MSKQNKPFWLEVPVQIGRKDKPGDAEIVIIGSGLSGVSTAYWLQKKGYKNLLLLDHEPENAASFRNCGHILYGTVESMQALVALHGEEIARELWQLSVELCHDIRETVKRLNLDVDYRQNGYLVMAIDASEHQEILLSLEYLNRFGFGGEYRSAQELNSLGFKNVFGARFEPGSAQAHPSKFRNQLLSHCLKNGLRYHSGVKVLDLAEVQDRVQIKTEGFGMLNCEALLSNFFAKHRLVEPFRGQIITSQILKHDFKVRYPHSFDHGYEYAIVTDDNRLMIGGWRNHTESGEVGIYDLGVNPLVEKGLQEFVLRHYDVRETIGWDYSWSGIMAASKTGFPFIGPTDSQRIFTCAGYTGHGFSWAHGSAKILANIIHGDPVAKIVREKFNPRFFM
ncbi:MAG: FAD-dependent oxidoreductase [Proteobacteria bacterium]|nr:FAD-dependent oxidoreductase [Pseudomonadota bacterium]